MNKSTMIWVTVLASAVLPNILIGPCISKEPNSPTERHLLPGKDLPREQDRATVRDPQVLGKIAQTMVQLRAPLPEGWKLASGIDRDEKKSVTFEYRNGTSITLTRYHQGVVLSQYVYYGDLTKAEIGGVDVDVDTRGFTSIGGSPIVYVRGHIAHHQSPRQVAVEMAHVRLENGDVIIIEVKEPDRHRFDSAAIKAMYDAIDRFALKVDPLRVDEYE